MAKKLFWMLKIKVHFNFRGAELINKILMREVTKQKIEEKQLLEKIKAKMNQLKEKQKHLKENYIEPEDHFAGIVLLVFCV